MTRSCIILLAFSCQAMAQTLVMPGDFPDPSVTKIGDTYWASATTSNWAPAFPLLASKDLVHWQLRGHAFPQLPSWADYYFWAPEISYENGRVFLYYAAHKRDGNLCVGIASADTPEGPYRDHGPIICQEVGSIDAFPMRDDKGKLYLIWKEDGNSVNKPTPIWAAEMNEDRTQLIGEKTELFRNTAAWEGNLVEGVSMIRHNGYYYAFYAGAGCCGRGCSYGLGVARAANLLGPWEKYRGNPLLATTDTWKCPGHGTPV
ncbi:MAG TPA: glycoside hydrolase family 43 protein, partial [Chryseosolibacter sp.]|nr:glycoside hydrolase family 43 protein [Chryseosolibacter sp.]